MWVFIGISSLALLMLVRGTGSPELPPIPAATERHVNDEPLPEVHMPRVSPTTVISDPTGVMPWNISTSQTFQAILS